MYDLIVAIGMVVVSFLFMYNAGRAETNLGFNLQMGFGAMLIVLSVGVAMGFMWPYLVLSVVGIIVGMTMALTNWKWGMTLRSLIWFVYTLFMGVALALNLSA